jgi:hypothetical protein
VFTVALQRLDQKIISGGPMTLKRMANVLKTDAMLLQECDRFSKYGDKSLTLYAGDRAIEIPAVFCWRKTPPVRCVQGAGQKGGSSASSWGRLPNGITSFRRKTRVGRPPPRGVITIDYSTFHGGYL